MTVYSHSRLNSFENCPKQFQFRYVMKIEQETEGIEAFVGKRVHEVLERLYEFVDRGQVPPLQKVVDRYYQLYDKHYDAERIRIVKKGIEPAFYRELGARCLRRKSTTRDLLVYTHFYSHISSVLWSGVLCALFTLCSSRPSVSS